MTLATTISLTPAGAAPTASSGTSESGTLRALLRPRSIAVVGASHRQHTIGHQLFANLLDHRFAGAVYPVNPRQPVVCSSRCYPSVSALPEVPDLAVVVVPRAHVLEVAAECGTAGVRALIVVSAGFKEVGPEGAGQELELLRIARANGMRLLGPNCMGVINTHADVSMNATFAAGMPPAGHAAFVSQSGALGASVLDYARTYGIGISQFVSVGNKADISGNDLLLAWEDDPAVRVILMYVENFGNPRRFLEIASRVSKKKPIIVVKSGRSRAGARAASSHTGALAASDVAVDALLSQAGVLRAGSIEELFDMAAAFGIARLPRSRRTAVVTNAGGPGILAADALEACGLEVADFSATTVAALAPLFPAEASIRNPLDMIASATPDGYRQALSIVLADPNIDAVIPIFVPILDIRQDVVAASITSAVVAHPSASVLAVLMGREGLPHGREELSAAGIPAYIFPESAARALAALNRQREWMAQVPLESEPLDVDRAAAARLLARVEAEHRDKLSELEAFVLLGAYGVAASPATLARDADAAAVAALEIGFPVAMKVVSPDIVHKSDVDGVRLGITNEGEVRDAFASIVTQVRSRQPGATITGLLIQRMIDGGRELIVGMSRDREFGPLVMFGLGGIFVEAMNDVAFRIAPIDARVADEMMRSIRGAPVLDGLRGQAGVDRRAVAEVICRVAQLAVDFPQILELDVNPLIASISGAVAADARVRIAPNSPQHIAHPT